MAKPKKRSDARKLRENGWRIIDIANHLDVSRASVTRWCRDIQLSLTQIKNLEDSSNQWYAQQRGAETNKRKALAERKQYQEQGRIKARNGNVLHRMGCMLYWAEGAKHRYNVRFVNTDVNMMKIFARFLLHELQAPVDKLRLNIMSHSVQPEEHRRVASFWLSSLNLPASVKCTVTIKKGTRSRHARYKNGICAIQISSVAIAQHIFGAIQEYLAIDKPEWML